MAKRAGSTPRSTSVTHQAHARPRSALGRTAANCHSGRARSRRQIAIMSTVSGGLELEKLRVAAASQQQFLVSPELHDPSVGHDRDAIGNADGREAVRDHEADPPPQVLLQLREDPRLRFWIE